MFAGMLRRIRECVRTGRYVMTVHGRQEMAADRLTLEEVREIIAVGRIVERQRDHRTSEWKYLIEGRTFDGRLATVVAKLGPTGKVVVITVYSS